MPWASFGFNQSYSGAYIPSFSPSIYGYLTKINSQTQSIPSGDIAVYEYTRDNFANGYSGPWLDNTENRELPSTLRWPYSKRDAQSPYDYLGWRKNPVADLKVPANVQDAFAAYEQASGLNPYIYLTCAWDWSDPSYCRQQLFDLGFTAYDLTP